MVAVALLEKQGWGFTYTHFCRLLERDRETYEAGSEGDVMGTGQGKIEEVRPEELEFASMSNMHALVALFSLLLLLLPLSASYLPPKTIHYWFFWCLNHLDLLQVYYLF